MTSYKLTPRAQQDLRGIWHNIATENELAADNLLNRLFEKFELVSRHPEMGRARPEIAAAVRLIIEGRYIAIYEPAPYGILIVAVIHGMRDPSQWLS